MLVYSIVSLFQFSENNSNLNHLEIGNVTEKVKVLAFFVCFLFHKYVATRYEFNLHLDPYFTFLLRNVFVVASNKLSCSKHVNEKKTAIESKFEYIYTS